MAARLCVVFLGAFVLFLPAWASWEPAGLSFVAGTVLGYVGGYLGAELGANLAQAAGWGLIDGLLGPIFLSYVGYALGSTLGSWVGVTWTGFQFGVAGDSWWSLLGASFGAGLAFALASFTDWEWALLLSPPLASLCATISLFLSFSSAASH